MKHWLWWLGALAMFLLGTAVMVVLSVPDDLGVLDQEVSEGFAYLFMFLSIAGDAVIPILPGETVVNAAAVLASQGRLDITWVVIASCLGAIVGDNALYWIARSASPRLEPQVARLEQDTRVQTVLRIVGDRAPLFIVLGRYVPGLRFFVNATMGIRRYPYRKFLLWSTIGGTIWGTYTALLAYWVGTALSGYPIMSFFLSGAITTALILIVFWFERRRSISAEGTPVAEVTAAD